MKKLFLAIACAALVALAGAAQTAGLDMESLLELLLPPSKGNIQPILDDSVRNMLTEVLEKHADSIPQVRFLPGDTILVILDRGTVSVWKDDRRVEIGHRYIPGKTRNDFKRVIAIKNDSLRKESIPLNVRALDDWQPEFLEWMFREIDRYVCREPWRSWQTCVYRLILSPDDIISELVPYYTSEPLTEEEYEEYKARYQNEGSEVEPCY